MGIRYEHLPELGVASERRKTLETRADYDALFTYYARTYLPRKQEELEKIKAWIRSGERVALTCYERDSNSCHRRCVAEALERKSNLGFPATHL